MAREMNDSAYKSLGRTAVAFVLGVFAGIVLGVLLPRFLPLMLAAMGATR